MSWIDFTRRNDPAHPQGLKLLQNNIAQHGYPKVLCFWTKAPDTVARLYHDVIIDMQNHYTLVLAQVTINNYPEMEPGVKPEPLTSLVNIQGSSIPLHRPISSDAIRIRFDPIIVGYTTPKHFKQTLNVAVRHSIKRIITNFLVPS